MSEQIELFLEDIPDEEEVDIIIEDKDVTDSLRSEQRVRNYLKISEWQKLKESIDNFRDKVIFNLLYSSGCRVETVFHTGWEN